MSCTAFSRMHASAAELDFCAAIRLTSACDPLCWPLCCPTHTYTMQWWIEGNAAVVLIAGEAAWSWRRYRQEVLQEAERAAARLARARARARHAAYCAAAAERVWPDVPAAALPPPLPAPAVCMPAVAQEPTAAAAAAGRSKGVDSDLKVALLAEEWEP